MTQDAPERVGWAAVLTDLLEGRELAPLQSEWAMEQVMVGVAPDAALGTGHGVADRAELAVADQFAALADGAGDDEHGSSVRFPSM